MAQIKIGEHHFPCSFTILEVSQPPKINRNTETESKNQNDHLFCIVEIFRKYILPKHTSTHVLADEACVFGLLLSQAESLS